MGNLHGRLVVAEDGGVLDVEAASGGRFAADPVAAFERWDELVAWARARPGGGARADPAGLGPPSPRPRQVFAVALNYRDHAGEVGLAPPARPSVFTKFVTALTGPRGEIALADGDIDWEVELVAVIGRRAERVDPARGWDHVAGLTVGQDLSDRRLQFAGDTPQFSLAKSRPGFAPTGPWLVTPDELADPDDLALGCSVNGDVVQEARTSDLVFGVPALVSYLSGILPLLPGDLVFTGTPAGVGGLRRPPRFLAPGDQLVSWVEGVGEMGHRFRAP